MDDIIKNTTYPRRWSFRELDFFSGGTSVKIKSDERVKSNLGAIISLLIYTLLGLSIYYFLNEFLDSTNPKIQINEQMLNTPTTFPSQNMGHGGLYFFFLVTNPSPQAGNTEPYYLSYDTLKKYYEFTSDYTETKYQVDGLVTKKVQSSSKKVELVKCNQMDWIKSKQFKDSLAGNNMTEFVIAEFAICPKFENSMDIYGDDQTLSSGRYKFTLSPCSNAEDPECAGAFDRLTSIGGQTTIIGTFRPVIDTSDKNQPFKYEVHMEDVVPIGLFLNTKVVVGLRNSQVNTDRGIFISMQQEESKAAIGALRLTYDPVVTVGDEIVAGSGNWGVKFVAEEPPLTIRIISSRVNTIVTRSYSTVPELIGNIGGAIEGMVMLCLVLLHWAENLILENRINYVVGLYLNLPAKIRPSNQLRENICLPCRRKKNKELAFKAQSSEVVGDIVDKALSIEQMSYNQILFRFILENSFPDEIRQLVPVVYVMKEILKSSGAKKLAKFSPRKQAALNELPKGTESWANSEHSSVPPDNPKEGNLLSEKISKAIPVVPDNRKGGFIVNHQNPLVSRISQRHTSPHSGFHERDRIDMHDDGGMREGSLPAHEYSGSAVGLKSASGLRPFQINPGMSELRGTEDNKPSSPEMYAPLLSAYRTLKTERYDDPGLKNMQVDILDTILQFAALSGYHDPEMMFKEEIEKGVLSQMWTALMSIGGSRGEATRK